MAVNPDTLWTLRIFNRSNADGPVRGGNCPDA